MKNFLALILFMLPLVFWRQVNANYLSTKTFFMYFAAGLALFALPDQLSLKDWPKKLWVLLSVIFVYHVSYYFWGEGFQWGNLFLLFKMLSFVSLALYFYSQNLKVQGLFSKLSYPFFGMWLFILYVTLEQVIRLRFIDVNIKTDAILSTFGNVNMFSEFAVLCMPFLLVWTRHKDRIPGLVKLAVLFAVSFLLLYCRSRSVWMGLIIWIGFLFFNGLKKSEMITLASALVLFLIAHFTTPQVDTINKFAPQYFSERASLYKGSVQLLADRPMGIAPGQFMSEIVPYLIDKEAPSNEFAYFDQPHSEFLKWGIQFGWAFLAVSLLLLVALTYELYRKYKTDQSPEKTESAFFVGSFLLLAPQLTFQFPFENPASIMVLALIFGLFMSSYREKSRLSIKYAFGVTGALAAACLVNAFVFFGSIYTESHYSNSTDLMSVVCRFYPVNFRACYFKNKDLFDQKNVNGFRTEFKTDFKNNPMFCDNLRLLPEYMNFSKDLKKTCEALQLYKIIYRSPQYFLPASYETCKDVRAPFQFESGEQFGREFRSWFERNE